MKIKCNSDDKFLLNKTLNLPNITTIVRSVFEEDGKCYPQVFLHECLYELQMVEYDRTDISEEIDIITKQMHQKNVILVIISTF